MQVEEISEMYDRNISVGNLQILMTMWHA